MTSKAPRLRRKDGLYIASAGPKGRGANVVYSDGSAKWVPADAAPPGITWPGPRTWGEAIEQQTTTSASRNNNWAQARMWVYFDSYY